MSLAISSAHPTFYPTFGLSRLRNQKGRRWAELVDWLSALPEGTPELMAFTLMMRRLRRTHDLDRSICRDPFCALCATAIVDSVKGGEESLLATYHASLTDVTRAITTMRVRPLVKQMKAAVA